MYYVSLQLLRALLVFPLLAVGISAVADSENPPPANKLEGYDSYTLQTTTMDAGIGKKKNADKILKRIIANLEEQVKPVLDEWNTAAVSLENPEKLSIEPRIMSLHKPSAANRVFAGSFAGGSRIVMRVRIVESESGKVIAEPEFYQHANAVGAAWSFGATDNAMLDRVTQMIAVYLKRNYLTPIGGVTGFEQE